MAARHNPMSQMPVGGNPYMGGSVVGHDYQATPPPQYMSPRPGMMVMSHGSGRPGMGMSPSSAMRIGASSHHHPHHHHHHQTRSSSSSSSTTEAVRKRLAEAAKAKTAQSKPKKRRLGERVLSYNVRDMVPESSAYMDLLTFEQKLDTTIQRKRIELQESLKRPSLTKQKRKLRVFITHQFYPGGSEGASAGEGSTSVPEWELKIEGRVLDELNQKPDPRVKSKFTSFFKSVVVELDKEAYGPDNHLIEWHRTGSADDSDGFTITRPGESTVKCTIILTLNYQPSQYKLTNKLAKLLGIHTATRNDIISAIWQYIKTNRLQDAQEREFVNNDKYFQQIFEVPRMKFTELPRRLQALLAAPDPIVVHHLINADAPDGKRTACYDVEVDIDDPAKGSMHSFLMSTTNQQEIATLDSKIHETVDQINNIKLQREFYLGFAQQPQKFINDWLASQSRDLKAMKDKYGNPETERKASYYEQPWLNDALPRYFYAKVVQQKHQLEQALGIQH